MDMGFLLRLILNALVLLLVAHLIQGFQVRSFGSALIAALVLGLLNALVRPILLIFTLPINILTLGLFTFVINALILWLAAALVPGFAIDRFSAALLAAIVMALINMVLSLFIP
jgi:putative membrane protein